MSQENTTITAYSDLVNVSSFWKKKEEFSEERGPVSFYCRDCRELVEVDQPDPKKQRFVCRKCSGENITVGTEAGLKNFYDRSRHF